MPAVLHRLRAVLVLVPLMFAAATGPAAGQVIDSPESWTEGTFNELRAGRYDGFEARLREALEADPRQLTDMVARLRQWAGTDQVVYVDLLLNQNYGSSLLRRVYQVHYGGRRFMFFLTQFARGSDGWLLMDFKASTSPGDFLGP
ncbi:hypothetical protein [Caenispirillum salinarum]|uniref:hypothetical protein n=1 Tax=Caenispirillum salinarum TaxID=859058 RepID=UPI00384B1A66